MYQVIKRDGRLVDFDKNKIKIAVKKAFISQNQDCDDNFLDEIVLQIINDFFPKINNNVISIEEIQDSIENVLIELNYAEVAKSFILYREQHKKIRNIRNVLNYKKVIDDYLNVNDWRVKENSTVTYSVGGLILSNSGAITANYWLSEIYDEEIARAHRNADIHLHDLSMLTGYCAGWSLKQLITEGLGGVPGKITSSPASHLATLCNQMVNFLGIMQNEWAGAQAFSSFDTYLAPFVKTDNLTYKEVKQCIQSFVFGVNTPSRWGCVDTDTEVLSTDGFKKYNELKEGDLIYTWNNGRLELNPVRKVIQKPFKGQLHVYQGRGYNQTVTPNHRVLVKKFNENEFVIKHSDEIFDVKTPYALPTQFIDSSLPEAPLSNDEICLAAMFYTDGNVDMRGNSVHKVSIFKGNDDIKEVCRGLGLEFSMSSKKGAFGVVNQYTFYGDAARTIMKLVGSKQSIDKKFLSMSKTQSELFLKTWSKFDGDTKKYRCQYDNETIRDQLQQIAILAGHTSYLWKKGKTNYVKIRQVNTITPTVRTTTNYDGIVWCPNVENGTAVFRKDGCIYISGQTQAPFSNITLDWTVPNDLAEMNAIVGGKEMPFKYKDCKKEMDMVNKAFIEIMIEGDANGRGFQYPIPTYSITSDFDWSETENNKLLFEMTSKYGTPYFSNYINSDMEPSDVRSMCCRLRLDLRELRKKTGGFFGSGESTGSIGVVTINMPRLAYLSENEAEFYKRLDKMMDIAARSLKTKRTIVTRLLDEGLYPYTKRYLGTFENHFSTIGLVGMNEACLNAKWLRKDLTHRESQKFTKDVLNHMRERLSDYQEQYGDLYNLEATPAESTAYRLARHDKEQFPDIITASENEGTPYYTNSSHLPVGYTDDIFEALDVQDELQTLYTSGTVFHAFLGEKLPSWKSAASLVRKIAENYKLPYYTISPTYSVCKNHGYISGEIYECPDCKANTEVYSRITGYYRPVQNWNDGKVQEFKERKLYDIKNDIIYYDSKEKTKTMLNKEEKISLKNYKTLLFGTKTCPNCKIATKILDKFGIDYEKIYVEDNLELAKQYNIKQVPALILTNDLNEVCEKFVNINNIKQFINTRLNYDN